VKNEGRNEAIAKLAARQIKKGRTVLVLVTYIEHGKELVEKLAKLVDPNLIEFVWSGTEDRKGLLEELRNKTKMCLVSTTVFSEGVDLPSLSCVIYARASKSAIDTLQSVGRALRRSAGKWKTIIFDFMDKSSYFKPRSSFRKHLLEKESEFKVKVLKGVVL
jgi:superfamily II DNA or RNA helicase